MQTLSEIEHGQSELLHSMRTGNAQVINHLPPLAVGAVNKGHWGIIDGTDKEGVNPGVGLASWEKHSNVCLSIMCRFCTQGQRRTVPSWASYSCLPLPSPLHTKQLGSLNNAISHILFLCKIYMGKEPSKQKAPISQ